MRLVQAAPALLHFALGRAGEAGSFFQGRRAPELDEERIRRVSELDVGLIHGSSIASEDFAQMSVQRGEFLPIGTS